MMNSPQKTNGNGMSNTRNGGIKRSIIFRFSRIQLEKSHPDSIQNPWILLLNNHQDGLLSEIGPT
jgi:hypothetical protein